MNLDCLLYSAMFIEKSLQNTFIVLSTIVKALPIYSSMPEEVA
jgi:hypothetical protein